MEKSSSGSFPAAAGGRPDASGCLLCSRRTALFFYDRRFFIYFFLIHCDLILMDMWQIAWNYSILPLWGENARSFRQSLGKPGKRRCDKCFFDDFVDV